MNKYRVSIGSSSFAEVDKTPLQMLETAGIQVVPNPYKRRLTEKETITHLENIDGLIAGLEPLNEKVLEASSCLKVIARVGIGMDNVDLDKAKTLGIKVSNTPEGPTEAVAEMCLASLLAIGRRIIESNSKLHSGIWEKYVRVSLRGIRVLLIGYGRIGRRFGEILRYFGSEIMVYDPFIDAASLINNEKKVTLEEGLSLAEVISLHASDRRTILKENEFAEMKKGVILLNAARGELVDEDALISALELGKINGVWLDAFWEEPYGGRLLKFDNVLLTPHVSTYTRQCRLDMEVSAVENLLRDLG
jgi:D-3-phosphoglycerate dehydrogenase / 2-oxoglutarate reductase